VERVSTDGRYFCWRSVINGVHGPEQRKNNRETTLLPETMNTTGITDGYIRYQNTVTNSTVNASCKRNEKSNIADPGVPNYYYVK
jgi:hypothetical protein